MNRRKNRGGSIRPQRVRSVVAEGVYNNSSFMHAATGQVGNVVRIQTASGSVWEGVFKTFSTQFDVVLELAARVDNPDSNNCSLVADSVVDKLIFKSCDIVTMVARDCDLDYATKDTFQTDTAISSRLNGSQRSEEKELEPWDASTGVNGEDTSLELEPGANGWDANDMFRKNEQVYGVQSTFDQSLSGYTVPLAQSDSQEYREAEAKAEQIASEIENQPSYKARLELENGDEEERFAAVTRPANNPDSGYQKGSSESTSSSGKYVPPAKRKIQSSNKLIRSTPPPSQSGSAQTTPSPKGNPPPLQYPTHPSPHSASNSHARDNQMNRDVPREPPQMQHVPNAAHIHNAHPPPSAQHVVNANHPMHPAQMGAPTMNAQPHPMTNHAPRQHVHTPPHVYQNPAPPNQGSARQQVMQPGGPHNGPPKPQMNGEAKPMPQRPPRNVYPSPNMQPPQQYSEPPPQQPKPEVVNHIPRHREEPVKELRTFSQEFKLVPQQEQVVQQPQEQMPPQQPTPKPHPIPQATPPQPSQSVSPPQDLEKVTNTLKKSNLNPLAKEFVLNPSAKPFTPRLVRDDEYHRRRNNRHRRSPSTPTASRPQTPQTPYIPVSMNAPPGQPVQMMVPMPYMVAAGQPQYQPPPQGNRLRKMPMSQMRAADMASQMQVAAATGQPLLAPAPLQQFVYPPGINPQAYQQIHTVRMYESPPQLQYLQPNPSNTPSPAQPPPYTQNQGPQPPPPQYQTAPPQGHAPFPMICPIIPTQPQMMHGMQYLQQPPPHQGPIQVMLPPPPQPQQHGPAP